MRGAFFTVVLAGVSIGLIIPTKAPPAAPAAAVPATGEAPRDKPVETVLRSQNGHYYTYANVRDEPVRFMIDTGSTTVALTKEDATRVGIKFDPNEFEHIGSGASGPVYGKLLMLSSVTLDGKRRYDVHGAVVEGLDISLLGQSFLNKMDRVEIKADQMRIR